MREEQPIPETSAIPRSTVTSAGAVTSGGSTTAISPSSPSSTPPTSSIPSANDSRVDSVDELAKQIARFSLLLQAALPNQPNGQGSSASDAARPPRPSAPGRSTTRSSKCIWCDHTEHFRRDCAELTAALNAGVTRYNDKGHLVNDGIGEELPLMFEKGGIKKVIEQGSSVTASTHNITIDELYGHLGGNSILRTTLDFEEGTRTDEIVDVNVAKRKFGRESHRRQVRPRTDAGPSQTLTSLMSPAPIPPVPTSQQSQLVYIEKVPDEEMSDVQVLPASSCQSKGQSTATGSGEDGKKYYLDSKLGQNVKTAQIGEKIRYASATFDAGNSRGFGRCCQLYSRSNKEA